MAARTHFRRTGKVIDGPVCGVGSDVVTLNVKHVTCRRCQASRGFVDAQQQLRRVERRIDLAVDAVRGLGLLLVALGGAARALDDARRASAQEEQPSA